MGNKALATENKSESLTMVFVYGTLKKGFGNHHLLSKSLYHGDYSTAPSHKMVSLGGFPGVVFGKGTAAIKGEVYEVADDVLDRLDRLEGYPSFYDRKSIYTLYGKAYMYVLSDRFARGLLSNHEEVLSGEWK